MIRRKVRVKVDYATPVDTQTVLYVALTPTTYVAAIKALAHLKPEYSDRRHRRNKEQLCADINTLLTAACDAVFMLKADKAVTMSHPKRTTDMMVHTFRSDCWPPAFTPRQETEDEQFARMVTAAY